MLTRRQREQLRQSKPAGRNRLQLAMALAGLTQVQLSERVGYTQSYISKVKNGQYSDELPGETMRTFAQFFGCSIEDIFPALGHGPVDVDRRTGDDRRVGGDRRSEGL